MKEIVIGAVAAVMLMGFGAARAEETRVPPPLKVPPLAEGKAVRTLALTKVGDSLKQGTPWLTVLWGSRCAPDSVAPWNVAEDAFEKNLAEERVFRDTLTGLGFKVAGDPNNLFKDANVSGEDGADLQVGALIKTLEIRTCSGLNRRDSKLSYEDSPGIGEGLIRVSVGIESAADLERDFAQALS